MLSPSSAQVVSAASVSKKSAHEKINPRQGLAHQLLADAEEQSKGLEAADRAIALWNMAYALEEKDKRKAVDLLTEAVTIAKSLDADGSQLAKDTRGFVEAPLWQDLARVAPERAEELAERTSPEAYLTILDRLVTHYQSNGKTEQAIEVLRRGAAYGELPYGAAGELMASLRSEQSAELQSVFLLALSSFQSHTHRAAQMGYGDFGNVVVRFAGRLPPALVMQAAKDLLADATVKVESWYMRWVRRSSA